MAKRKTDKRIAEYRTQYESWLQDLQSYHTQRFDKNYKQYTAYAQTKGTTAKISDPVAPEITERQINRLFERKPKFFVLARGQNIPSQITNIISAIPAYYWDCPERVKSSGPMKSKMKVLGREFCVTGQCALETFYNEQSDTPDASWVPIEDVIFDPTKTPRTSKRIYIRKYVDLDYIKDRVEIYEDGKFVRGLFDPKAVKRIEEIYSETENQNDPSSNRVTRSGSTEISTKVGPIELITLLEGAKVCRFIKGIDEDETVVLQEYNSALGEIAIDTAMDIELPKQPYAFSMLDFLNGLTHLKDLFISQIADYGSKALNQPLFFDPNAIGPVDRYKLANAFKVGGLVPIAPQAAEHKVMPSLGNLPFQLLDYIQQRAEAVSGIPSVLGGNINPALDSLNRTASGKAMQLEQALGPLEDRRENIEESIIEPMANKWLKMAGILMGENEIKYVLITGESPKWVRITKGLLTGKIKIADLLEAELIDEIEASEIMTLMVEQGQNPDKDLVFDVDWIVKVETGSTGQADKEKELQAFDTTIQMGMQMGIQMDAKKVWTERALKAGIKEPEQYLMQEQEMMPGIPEQMGMGQMANIPMQEMPQEEMPMQPMEQPII